MFPIIHTYYSSKKKKLLESFQNPKTWAEGVNESNGSGIIANLAKGLGGLHPIPLCQQDHDFKNG